jgi:hypothetical protein
MLRSVTLLYCYNKALLRLAFAPFSRYLVIKNFRQAQLLLIILYRGLYINFAKVNLIYPSFVTQTIVNVTSFTVICLIKAVISGYKFL